MSINNRNAAGQIVAHEATDKNRAEVAALTSFGHTQEEISAHLGVSVETLVKYYEDELLNSVVRANAKVASKLFNKAVNQDDLSAQIFWLKTRGKWRTEDKKEDSKLEGVVEKILDKLVE